MIVFVSIPEVLKSAAMEITHLDEDCQTFSGLYSVGKSALMNAVQGKAVINVLRPLRKGWRSATDRMSERLHIL
jgi:putative ribosome biogenesis GTPase RsgA